MDELEKNTTFKSIPHSPIILTSENRLFAAEKQQMHRACPCTCNLAPKRDIRDGSRGVRVESAISKRIMRQENLQID
jgi:hypothetical protein